MRVPEEVKALKLQAIAIALVFITSVLIQFSDYKISEYKNSIILGALETENSLQLFTAFKLYTEFAVFKQLIPFEDLSKESREANIRMLTASFDAQLPKTKESIKINEELRAGRITLREYYQSIVASESKELLKYLNQYERQRKALNGMASKETIWQPLKTYLFFPLQLFFISWLFIGYVRLMKEVHNRSSTKKK